MAMSWKSAAFGSSSKIGDGTKRLTRRRTPEMQSKSSAMAFTSLDAFLTAATYALNEFTPLNPSSMHSKIAEPSPMPAIPCFLAMSHYSG